MQDEKKIPDNYAHMHHIPPEPSALRAAAYALRAEVRRLTRAAEELDTRAERLDATRTAQAAAQGLEAPICHNPAYLDELDAMRRRERRERDRLIREIYIARMARAGLSDAEIANKIGRSKATVQRSLKRIRDAAPGAPSAWLVEARPTAHGHKRD